MRDKIDALFRETFDLEGRVVFFPVRHHSPACSFHLEKTIETYNPEIILIEGPDDSQRLVEHIIHPESKPPLAIYYSFADKKGMLGEVDRTYACYYPFLEFSPEYRALKLAAEQGIPTGFIDLPHTRILAAARENAGLRGKRGKNYFDDYLLMRSRYIETLCRKQGVRDFNELWETLYEIDGLYQDTAAFVKNLLAFCYLSRCDYTEDMLAAEGCGARESHMAEHIRRARDRYSRVLVVTGGFHTPGLAQLLQGKDEPDRAPGKVGKKQSLDIDQKDVGIFALAYSFEESDLLSGYASGMPHPAFYQEVFANIRRGLERPYRQAVLTFIIRAGRWARNKDAGVSTADQIEAFNLARGLTALRGKHEAGVFELKDAVQSAFVKGELTVSSRSPLAYLDTLLTGRRLGKICDAADIPPVVRDFREKAAGFRLKLTGSGEREAVLNIYKSASHREKSHFFHTLAFLETGFCSMVQGPDFRRRRGMNLVREIWTYRFHPAVEGRLIECSVYGGSLAEVAGELVRLRLNEPDMDAEGAALLLIDSLMMGLEGSFELVMGRMKGVIAREGTFFSMASCVYHLSFLVGRGQKKSTGTLPNGTAALSVLHSPGRAIGSAGMAPAGGMSSLFGEAWARAVLLMGACGAVPEVEEDAVIGRLKDLYQVSLGYPGLLDGQLFSDGLSGLVEVRGASMNSAVEGAACGLLHGLGRMPDQAVIQRARGYFSASGDMFIRAAAFLKGLFATGRDILLCREELLEGLDVLLGALEEERFLQVLPNLRLAFSYFTPGELEGIGKRVAGRYGLEEAGLFRREAVDPNSVALGEGLDGRVKEILASYGLLTEGKQ